MPSYWKDGQNSISLFDETGEFIGKQYKQLPYVNEKNGFAEALNTPPNTDVFIIHLVNKQRVAIVVCADFVANIEFVRRFLCEKLGVTLVIIPSYSQGEQDFVNALSILKHCGASAIWGNCCGAIPHTSKNISKRIIGGAGIAGIDNQIRFGSNANCGFICNNCKSCYYKVDLPTSILWEKPNSPPEPIVEHSYRKNSTYICTNNILNT